MEGLPQLFLLFLTMTETHMQSKSHFLNIIGILTAKIQGVHLSGCVSLRSYCQAFMSSCRAWSRAGVGVNLGADRHLSTSRNERNKRAALDKKREGNMGGKKMRIKSL